MTNRQIIKFAKRLLRAKGDARRTELMNTLADPGDYAAAFVAYTALNGDGKCELVCSDPAVIARANEMARFLGSTYEAQSFH